MHASRRPAHQDGQHRYINNGLRLAPHYDRRSAPSWLPPRRFLCNGTLPVETSGIDSILSYRAALKSIWRLFIRKGVIWLIIAMIAGIVPVVSLAIFFAHLLRATLNNLISLAGPQLPEPEWYYYSSIVYK